MRSDAPSAAEVQANFERTLKGIQNGEISMCPTGLGFDGAVSAALTKVAITPNHPSSLIAAARVALSQQLSGVANADAWLAQLAEE